MESIRWARLADLSPAVEAFPSRTETYLMVERLPQEWLDEAARETGLRFEHFDPTKPFESYNQWERGRIFNTDGELRWEKIGAEFHTVFVGDDGIALPDGFRKDPLLANAEQNTRQLYLWGKRLEAQALQAMGRQPTDIVFAEFVSGNIVTEYPAPDSQGRVQVRVIEYLHPHTRERLYYRFQGVG